MQRLLSPIRKFFKRYHWHWALLRLTIALPIVGLICIGQAGERLYSWADEYLPDAEK